MKKFAWLFVFILFVIVVGCNDDEKVTDVTEDIQVEKNESTSNQTTDATFRFTHFDLDVDYRENEEFDVDYENKPNELEAEISDDRNNRHLQGNEAYAELKPIFEKLTFDANTEDEQVISEVVNAFQLGDDFVELELQVTFDDGTTKNYRKTK